MREIRHTEKCVLSGSVHKILSLMYFIISSIVSCIVLWVSLIIRVRLRIILILIESVCVYLIRMHLGNSHLNILLFFSKVTDASNH